MSQHKTPEMIARAYYTAMSNKDLAALAEYLHSQVQFVGPLARFTGKEALLDSVQQFMKFFNALEIRASFGSQKQAVIIYDLEFSEPIGAVHAVALVTCESNFITGVELFYDARPFDEQRREIFRNQQN